MDYKIGQRFSEDYPLEAAEWCNANGCRITELPPTADSPRCYEIQYDTVPAEALCDLLRTQLQQDDYKIIKCMECALAGETAPYDITAIHAQRQILRERIEALSTEAGTR